MKQVKKCVIALCLIAVAAGIPGSITAYLKVEKSRDNIPVIGDNTISIEEEFSPPEKQDYTPDDNGTEKIVKFKNTGSVNCFVRARIEISTKEIENIIQLSNGESFVSYKDYLTDHGEWIYNTENGYFYYTDKLETTGTNTETAELLKAFKVDYSQNNSVLVQPYDIIVYYETVQAVLSSIGEETDNYVEAWNDFENKLT